MLANLPRLDERLCIACGDCIFVCPTQCLSKLGLLPELTRPLACITCGTCVAICPVAALQMTGFEYKKKE